MLNIFSLTNKYQIKRLTENDIGIVLKLYQTNEKYFSYFGDIPTKEIVREDMCALPPNTKNEDKHYFGIFDKDKLACVVDMIDGYPEKGTIYIGLFMLDKSLQHQGLGTKIIDDFIVDLSKQGYKYIKLAYIDNNDEANCFWRKNGFIDSGKKSTLKNTNITELKRNL